MKRLSLRSSLTAWFLGLTMLLLGGFSATLYAALARALHGGVDAELLARAESMLGICEWDEEIEDVEFKLSAPLAAELAAGNAGRGLAVWTWPARRLLHHSGGPLGEEPPRLALADGATRAVAWEELPGEPPRRVCTMLARAPAVPAHDDDPDHPAFDVVVRTSESLAPVDAQLASVRWQVVALTGIASLLVLAFGAFLSRRFVRPLRELGAAAAAVRPGEHTTMPRRGTGDELDVLADQLDRAFTSLAESLDRQTRFTSNAAHELRNPLAVVRNAAEVALRHDRTGEEYRRFLDDVRATALRMGRIVEALLQLARLDADGARARFEVVDLTAVARAAVATALPGALVRNGSDASVRGQAGLLRVLVDNLLSNAREHSGGRPSDVEVDVAAADGGRVALSVRDRGPGVPDAEKLRLFERFFRGSAAHRHAGAGLGLSIVADVARLHGATCRIEDAHPGTRVVVEFEAAAGAAAEAGAGAGQRS